MKSNVAPAHPTAAELRGITTKINLSIGYKRNNMEQLEMLKAKKSVDFAMFTFSRTLGIDDTLIALARSGIKVRGILDGSQGNQR